MGMTDAQKADYIKSLEAIRERMNAEIDQRIADFVETGRIEEEYFEPCRFITETHRFKGEKSAAVMMPSGKEHQAIKWTDVVSIILDDCNADPLCHEGLLNICGKVFGKTRPIFSNTPAGMMRPVQINDEKMYFETHYDTETLLNVLLNRVLKAVGYDYRGIRIRCRLRHNMQM